MPVLNIAHRGFLTDAAVSTEDTPENVAACWASHATSSKAYLAALPALQWLRSFPYLAVHMNDVTDDNSDYCHYETGFRVVVPPTYSLPLCGGVDGGGDTSGQGNTDSGLAAPVDIPFVPEAVLVKFDWMDQGWGNQKGEVAIGIDSSLAADGNLAPHNLTTHRKIYNKSATAGGRDAFLSSVIIPEPPPKGYMNAMKRAMMGVDPTSPRMLLRMRYKVGGGGGHQLTVNDFSAVILSQSINFYFGLHTLVALKRKAVEAMNGSGTPTPIVVPDVVVNIKEQAVLSLLLTTCTVLPVRTLAHIWQYVVPVRLEAYLGALEAGEPKETVRDEDEDWGGDEGDAGDDDQAWRGDGC